MSKLSDAIFGAIPAIAATAGAVLTDGATAPLAVAADAKEAANIGAAIQNAPPPPQVAAPPPPPTPAPQMQAPQLVTSDERRKTGVQSGTAAVKDFLSRFGDSALAPPAPVRSDARAKMEAYAAGQKQGQMEATQRWARFAPNVDYNKYGPIGRPEDAPTRAEARAGMFESKPGQNVHGAALGMGISHIQPAGVAGAPLPVPVQSGFPGHDAEARAQPMGAPAMFTPENQPDPREARAAAPPPAPQPMAMMPQQLTPEEQQRQLALAMQGQPVGSDRNLKTQVRSAERGIKDFLTQVYGHGYQ